ncbi:Protein CBG26692 [Caenorhabditis briggsae]|uniref:Protein CBG26692 n=1 Tax=Caenorhabditis briggsae TaxID=6238 RepID=B6IE64_CAEBR|nr:Protein CBG26692 [Caenorhabditis briggsae]CAS01128.1 Protein CBG26692 [Caenorhabditis briggsae]
MTHFSQFRFFDGPCAFKVENSKSSNIGRVYTHFEDIHKKNLKN